MKRRVVTPAESQHLKGIIEAALARVYEAADYLEQQVDEHTDGPATIRACAHDIEDRLDQVSREVDSAFRALENLLDQLAIAQQQRANAIQQRDQVRAAFEQAIAEAYRLGGWARAESDGDNLPGYAAAVNTEGEGKPDIPLLALLNALAGSWPGMIIGIER